MLEDLLVAIRGVFNGSEESWAKFKEELAQVNVRDLSNCRDLDSKSMPLFAAIESENPDIVKALIEKCPEIVDCLNEQKQNILFVVNDYGNIFNVLLESLKFEKIKELAEQKDNNGNNIIHIQAGNIGNFKIFKKLCEDFSELTNQLNKNNETPLHLTQDIEKAKLLTEKMSIENICQKSISIDSQYDGSTVLHHAILAENTDLIKLIIDKCPQLIWVENQERKNALDLTKNERIKKVLHNKLHEQINSITNEKEKLAIKNSDLINYMKHIQLSLLKAIDKSGGDEKQDSMNSIGQLPKSETGDDYSDM